MARDLHLTDPTAMRALAHPLRLRLLGELRVRGPQTVGMLAAVVDEAAGSVSHHMGVLARHGFVEVAPELARDRRERWWRAAHERTQWEPLEVLADPERRAASDVLRRAVFTRYLQSLEAHLEQEPALPAEWVRSTASGDAILHLTADELAELREDLEEFVEHWQSRSDATRPQAEPVSLIYHAFRRPS